MLTGEGDFEVISAKNVELSPGLGLFPGAILDQHFVARKRQNRLLSVVLEHPQYLGVGIDEATAAWLKPDGTFEVLGDGAVVVYDAARRPASPAPRAKAPFSSASARPHAPTSCFRGDGFDLAETEASCLGPPRQRCRKLRQPAPANGPVRPPGATRVPSGSGGSARPS